MIYQFIFVRHHNGVIFRKFYLKKRQKCKGLRLFLKFHFVLILIKKTTTIQVTNAQIKDTERLLANGFY